MTIPGNPFELFTPFIPTTWNIPEEEDRRRVFLVDTFSTISDVLNDKKIGMYVQSFGNFNGEKWIYDTPKKVRNGFQAIARVPSFVSTTIPLPITDVNPQFVITLAYGVASKPCSAVGAGDGDYFSFFSQGNTRIGFTLSDTTITIVTNGSTAAYSGFIVIHYLRDGI